ncbi:unnamed protein product [[Candida] boidinii]|uniref:Unnamed protein product n=1 Tax=Candida boidinii TaxID=5477 RepID=A0ACB5TGD4_CANBO|nr:unnamed protein product [[Candida] boidinii]
MTLSSHIDPDILEQKILEQLKSSIAGSAANKFLAEKTKFDDSKRRRLSVSNNNSAHPLLSKLAGISIKDKYKIPENTSDPKSTYTLIHDELILDGKPTLNLASFVNTFVSDESKDLILENLTKNLADNDEYPIMLELHQRCVSILANLWNAPTGEIAESAPMSHTASSVSTNSIVDDVPGDVTPSSNTFTFKNHQYLKTAMGTATTGSSEAIMLGGLAMKKRWQAKRKALGLDYYHPNIIMASCCQVALEKFARYFDVEERVIPVSSTELLLDYSKIKENCDENTIGIFVIVGSTYTGGFENVEKVNEILDEVQEEKGFDIPIHVDGASGGFVAPFLYPDYKWDFRVPRVASINTSGHKFGLVTAGLGWIIFRDQTYLPEELKFQLQYLGGLEESYTINFSRPGFQVIHQYYNFLTLGREGYFEIFDNSLTNARVLSNFLEATGYFTCISNLHLPKGVSTRDADGSHEVISDAEKEPSSSSNHSLFNEALPVVSFQFTEEFRKKYPEIPQSIIATLLRNKGWIIPNYPLPKSNLTPEQLANTNNEILRVVVRYNLTNQLLDKLIHDIVDLIQVLIKSVDLVRDNLKKGIENSIKQKTTSSTSDISDTTVYNMLLSIANDGNEKTINFRNYRNTSASSRSTHNRHKKHKHSSFRGTC